MYNVGYIYIYILWIFSNSKIGYHPYQYDQKICTMPTDN